MGERITAVVDAINNSELTDILKKANAVLAPDILSIQKAVTALSKIIGEILKKNS